MMICNQRAKWILTIIIACACSAASATYGASRTLVWQDADFCRYDVTFDSTRYTEQHVKNTIDFIWRGDVFHTPDHDGYFRPGEASAAQYLEACELQAGKLAAFAVVAMPGIEEYRQIKLQEIKNECEFKTIYLRGSLNAAALRDYTPAAAQCSRFVDALEGKLDINGVWRDVVQSTCAKHFNPENCSRVWLEKERKPGADERIHSDVFEFGWNNCAVTYLRPVARIKQMEMLRVELDSKMRSLFRIKRRPCVD